MFFTSSGDAIFIGDLYEIFIFDIFPRPLRHTGIAVTAVITPGIGLVSTPDTGIDLEIY